MKVCYPHYGKQTLFIGLFLFYFLLDLFVVNFFVINPIGCSLYQIELLYTFIIFSVI